MRSPSLLILATLFLSGCATALGRGRLLAGAGVGAVAGATGGAAMSPNNESRALNALVFGLSGALAGGLIAALSEPQSESGDSPQKLKDRELGSDRKSREFLVLPNQELPDFLKSRVHPLVIEEFVETDRVTEEGTLHEPHRAYRIKRPAELYSKPIQEQPKRSSP